MSRDFTIFMKGDEVTVVNDVDTWKALGHNETHFTVRHVYDWDNVRHAFEDTCDDSNCLHSRTHPQLLQMDNGMRASGFWFDTKLTKDLGD